MPVITSPSQLFRFNDRRDPTHTCFVFQFKVPRGPITPKFDCSCTTGTLFRVRSYAASVYTCELFLPIDGSPEISDPQWLAVAVTTEMVRKAGHLYDVELVGVEDYSRYHSESTDEDDCYI
jgi:hypothetical protein